MIRANMQGFEIAGNGSRTSHSAQHLGPTRGPADDDLGSEPRRMLGLQRTVGNRAAAALAQRSVRASTTKSAIGSDIAGSAGPTSSSASNLLVQREITPDKFNVIGEWHTASRETRDFELEALSHVLGRKLKWRESYWAEPDLRIEKADRWGDSRVLRTKFIRAQLADRLTEWRALRADGSQPSLDDLRTGDAQDILNKLKGTAEKAYAMIREPGNHLSEHAEEMTPIEGQIGDVRRYSTWLLERKPRREALALASLWGLATEDSSLWEMEGGRAYSHARSDFMHDSANLAAERGRVNEVWKIGQDHVADIERDHTPDERRYALSSADQLTGLIERNLPKQGNDPDLLELMKQQHGRDVDSTWGTQDSDDSQVWNRDVGF